MKKYKIAEILDGYGVWQQHGLHWKLVSIHATENEARDALDRLNRNPDIRMAFNVICMAGGVVLMFMGAITHDTPVTIMGASVFIVIGGWMK